MGDAPDRGARAAPPPTTRRRLAAAGALLALLAALAVVVAALLHAPGRLVAVLLLTTGAVVAAWTALVHRGVRRLAAATGAGCAVVGVVALLVSRSLPWLVLLLALMAASGAASRVALGSAPRAAGRQQVGPARQGVLLMNPWSGNGTVVRLGLAEAALRRGITPIVLERGDDLRALAERAVADGADVIGMAGGDGSQALVADVARQHDVPFVCVPAGTRNHFALDLGLDRADVTGALDAYGPAVERRVDLAEVAGRVFVNNASIGAYATVVQSPAYRDAKLATVVGLLPDLLGPDGHRVDLRFAGRDGSLAPPVDVVLVSNGAYHLDRINGFGRRDRLDAGTLGVVTVTVGRALEVPQLLAAEAVGRLSRFPGYQEWTAGRFDLDSTQPLIDVGVDGEAVRLPPPLRFRSLPGALRVRTPVTPRGADRTPSPRPPGLAARRLVSVLSGRPPAGS
jgi:diacylglycerol kinase family enzyme